MHKNVSTVARSGLVISQKQEFTTRIALSKCKHEYNLVLTIVYKVNYPKQESLHMSEMS